MAPTDPAVLAVIRLCERADCTFSVNDGIAELKDILQAMSNHILSMHPVAAGGGEGGVGQEEQKVTRQSLRWKRNVMRSSGLLGVPASNVGN